jgi:hypothetical protein
VSYSRTDRAKDGEVEGREGYQVDMTMGVDGYARRLLVDRVRIVTSSQGLFELRMFVY